MPGFPGGMMPAPEGLRPGGVFDPRMAELDRTDQELNAKSVDLSMRFRHAPPAEREKIKQEISEAVNRHFDVRQERRELQLQRLEEELARLKESIQARQQAREEIVKKRLAELLGETDDLNF
jgi:chromosome segregation ATPase